MNILVFSDLHIFAHHDFSYILPDGTNSRLSDCLGVLDKVVEYYEKYKCKAAIFGGDLYHSPKQIATSTLELSFRRLEQMTSVCDLFMLAGNHDLDDRCSLVYPMKLLPEANVVINEYQAFDFFGKLKIHCMAYIRDTDRYADCLKAIKRSVDANKPNILVTHCGLGDAVNGINEIKLRSSISSKELRATGVDFVFAGHHHTPQRLAENAIVIGSPLQLNMLDANSDRGLVIYDTDRRQVERVWLDNSTFHQFEFRNGRELDRFISKRKVDIVNGYVRIWLRFKPSTSERDRINSFLYEQKARRSEVKVRSVLDAVPRNKEIVAKAIKSSFDLKSVVEDYVDHVKPDGLDRARAVKVGKNIFEEYQEGLKR